MGYEVKVLADSIADGVRLTTASMTYPRIIHSEVMTHRMLSRNAASSRAIPVEKSIARVRDGMFVPEQFLKNQRGMQAGDAVEAHNQTDAISAWGEAAAAAIVAAQKLAALDVHKHWANRVLEPYSWITTIVTATEWDNFFALRCHPAAAPEFQRIAGMMRDAMKESMPSEIASGEWHLPFVTGHDDWASDVKTPIETKVKLSVARCARVSYLTHDGKRDVDADLALYERLLTSGHMSPFEHAAQVRRNEKPEPIFVIRPAFYGNFRVPWIQYRKQIEGETVFRGGR